MGGLGSGVDDQLDLAAVLGEERSDAVVVADVDCSRHGRSSSSRPSRSLTFEVEASGPKNVSPHIVFDPDHIGALLCEEAGRLGSNQTAGAGHDNHQAAAPDLLAADLAKRGGKPCGAEVLFGEGAAALAAPDPIVLVGERCGNHRAEAIRVIGVDDPPAAGFVDDPGHLGLRPHHGNDGEAPGRGLASFDGTLKSSASRG